MSRALAIELAEARETRTVVALPPSARETGFDLAAAYDVEAELARMRLASGHRSVGRKVGYANKAVWRALKLETLVWAHMYDDTIVHAAANAATLHLARVISAKIEPEIVFKLKSGLDANAGAPDAATALAAVEWLALGFEIIDCPFPDWKFQPADFVAAFGLHAALVVGDPIPIHADTIPALVEQLAAFKVRLAKDGQLVAEGGGRNSLRSPALCLAELAAAIGRHPTAAPLSASELISSGTLTESQPIVSGETWTASIDGLPVTPLTVHITP